MLEALTNGDSHAPDPIFPKTLWPLVLSAKAADQEVALGALRELCAIYRIPIEHWLRSIGHGQDAQELAAAFIEHFLIKNRLVKFERREDAKFRSFLKTCLRNFVASYKKAEAKPVTPLDGHDLSFEADFNAQFDLKFAAVMHRNVLAALAQKHANRFGELQRFLFGLDQSVTYAEVSRRLGMSEGAVKVAVARLREAYYDGFRMEVAKTVRPELLDEETRYLIGLVAKLE